MKEIVERLTKLKKTISTMESATGGYIVNAITNVEGASEVIKFSAVTYANEFKIKMGVDKDTISKYTVYSREVAREMSKKIAEFTNSNYGIGITGQLKKKDIHNLTNEDNKVYISIYDNDNHQYYEQIYECISNKRCENKDNISKLIEKMLKDIIK